MPRPLKCRRIASLPNVTYYKPAGIPLRVLEEVRLSVEEAEAIRLKDIEGLEGEQGAKNMNISRPTFQRILASGRRKVADALLNGKAIRIEGGSFELAFNRFRCRNGHQWDVPLYKPSGAASQSCPVCYTPDFNSISPLSAVGRGRGMGVGRGRRYGRQ
jgi:uncharacterized protein